MLNNILEEAGLIKESSLKRLLPYLDDAERLGEFTNVITNSEAGALRSLIEKGGDIARMGAHNAKRLANLQSRFAKDPTLLGQLSNNERSLLGRLLGKINFDPATFSPLAGKEPVTSSGSGSIGSTILKNIILKEKAPLPTIGSSSVSPFSSSINIKRISPWIKKYKDLSDKKFKKALLATGIGAGAGGTTLGALGSTLFGSDEEES